MVRRSIKQPKVVIPKKQPEVIESETGVWRANWGRAESYWQTNQPESRS